MFFVLFSTVVSHNSHLLQIRGYKDLGKEAQKGSFNANYQLPNGTPQIHGDIHPTSHGFTAGANIKGLPSSYLLPGAVKSGISVSLQTAPLDTSVSNVAESHMAPQTTNSGLAQSAKSISSEATEIGTSVPQVSTSISPEATKTSTTSKTPHYSVPTNAISPDAHISESLVSPFPQSTEGVTSTETALSTEYAPSFSTQSLSVFSESTTVPTSLISSTPLVSNTASETESEAPSKSTGNSAHKVSSTGTPIPYYGTSSKIESRFTILNTIFLLSFSC